MTLDETLSNGQSGHLADHEAIAKTLNRMSVVSSVTCTNTTTNTDMATFTIPAGRLATDGDSLRMTVFGTVTNSTGSNLATTWRGVIGTTTVLTTNAFTLGTSATARGFRIIIDLARISGTSQIMSAWLQINNAAATSWPGVNLGAENLGYGTAAETLANQLAFKLQVELGTASNSATVVATYARVEYLSV